MKAKIFTKKGTQVKEMAFPEQFKEEIRPDLIKRAVLALQSHNRQPYGAFEDAGAQHSTKISRRRHNYKGSYGHGISRVPRKILSRNGTRFNWVGAFAPGTVGGRRAHPPKSEKIIEHKINKKEKRKAIRSALSASIIKELVTARGHKISTYPLLVEDKAEDIEKTSEAKEMLQKLGLADELRRCEEKTIRAGKGKMRGRKYKKKKGPLLVVSKYCSLIKAAQKIPGVDIVQVDKLNASHLAPGTDYGRLTIYTEPAIKKIHDNKLFTKYYVRPEEAKK